MIALAPGSRNLDKTPQMTLKRNVSFFHVAPLTFRFSWACNNRVGWRRCNCCRKYGWISLNSILRYYNTAFWCLTTRCIQYSCNRVGPIPSRHITNNKSEGYRRITCSASDRRTFRNRSTLKPRNNGNRGLHSSKSSNFKSRRPREPTYCWPTSRKLLWNNSHPNTCIAREILSRLV